MDCFVIGPIGDRDALDGSDERQIYESALIRFSEVIEPACKRLDVHPTRADTIAAAGEITEQVLRNLLTADVVIADLTGHNPNVMYELGLRHTTGLATFQLSELQSLAFDVRQIRTIFFPETEAGRIRARDELTEQLQTFLGTGSVELPSYRAWRRYATVATPLESDSPEPDSAATPPTVEVASGEPDVVSEPPGFLELLAETEAAQPEFTELLEEATAVADRIGEEVGQATQRLVSASTAGQKLAITNSLAKKMSPLIDEMSDKIVRMDSRQRAIAPGVNYLLSKIEAEEDGVEPEIAKSFLETLVGLGSTTEDSIKSSQGWRKSLEEGLGASRQLDAVYRRLMAVLDRQTLVFAPSVELGQRAAQIREGRGW